MDIQQELQTYIDQHDVHKLVALMVESLLIEKPSNPIQYIVDYLGKKYPDKLAGRTGAGEAKGEDAGKESDSDSDSDDDDDDIGDMAPPPPRTSVMRRGRRRTAVSAEAGVDPKLLRQKWEAEKKTYEKSDAEKDHIRTILKANIFLKNLDDDQTDVIVDSMFPKEYNDGDVIIKQGDPGEEFYVVDSGVPEVYVNKDGAEVKVLTYGEGDAFGELALMYNAPRAATVKANGAVKVWALDRLTFKVILMDTTMKKRNVYKGFLEQVDLLKSLSEYERLTIADSLVAETFPANHEIIRQYEAGDKFYIIEQGSVVCTQSPAPSEPAVEVMRLKAGQYFGEIALLTQEPRKATVTTAEPTKVLSLDRSTFVRVMGPLKDILKRNMEQYSKVMASNI